MDIILFSSMIHNTNLLRVARLYLGVFLLPFILLSVLLYGVTERSSFYGNVSILIGQDVAALVEFESLYKSFGAVISSIEFNTDVRNSDTSVYSGKHAVQNVLRALTETNDLFLNIWLWLPDEDILLSGSDSLTIKRMDSGRFVLLGFSQASIGQLLQDGNIIAVRDQYVNRNCLLFPFRIWNINPAFGKDACLVFQVNHAKLESQLRALVENIHGSASLALVKNEQKIVEITSHVYPMLSSKSLEEFPVNSNRLRTYARYDGSLFAKRRSFITRVDGEYLSLQCTRPLTAVNYFRTQMLVLMLLSVLLTASLAVTVVIVYKLYKPVQGIRSTLSRQSSPKPKDEPVDDYEFIESCLDNLLREYKRLSASSDKTEDTIYKMIEYLDAQYASPDFSIKKMAEDFSLPISTLSNYFKSNMNILISDYIANLKMNKAKSLLETTDMSIQEVGLAVGYFNVSSFIRRFNQINGVTPKEYRVSRETDKN